MNAVRRRIATGEAGAAHVGRRFLLSREALDAELVTLAKKAPKSKTEAPDELAEMRRTYGLVRRAS